MARVIALQEICNKASEKYNFADYNFTSFARNMNLFEHNQQAVKNAFISLLEYQNNKRNLWDSYKLFIPEVKDKNFKFTEDDINRASFWMATGSGKTIVLLKLVETLSKAMKRNKISSKKMLLLAPTDKIINQFKKLADVYNITHSNKIKLIELDKYQSSEGQLDFGDINLFYTRSDLIDVEKNVASSGNGKRLDYKDYLEKDGWYVFLDEAHKGQDTTSTRKHYYQELAKNGFIFNFSATFSDVIDIFTCAYNYNLQKFNLDGYGKLISVLDDELDNFKKSDKDFTDDVKVKLITKSFIIFASIKKAKKSLQDIDDKLYHNPLMVAVCDKVNTIDAGLKLYFKTISDILANDINNLKTLKNEVISDLENKDYQFHVDKKTPKELLNIIKNITSDEIKELVFHSSKKSTCEANIMKGNSKEIAFKSKGADKPFLLLNVGDNTNWKQTIVSELEMIVNEDIHKTYFDNIEDKNSPINIMLGSKVFVEGWDCNRVNFINFINIGGADAVKYVLQTIGRGIRVEPIKGQRKRFEYIYNSEFSLVLEKEIKKFSSILESLYVFATHKKAVESIIKGLEQETINKPITIKGIKKNKNLFSPLYVPQYKKRDDTSDLKYTISRLEYRRVLDYINSSDIDVLLLNLSIITNSDDMCYSTIKKIKDDKNFTFNNKVDTYIDELALINKIDLFFNLYEEK